MNSRALPVGDLGAGGDNTISVAKATPSVHSIVPSMAYIPDLRDSKYTLDAG